MRDIFQLYEGYSPALREMFLQLQSNPKINVTKSSREWWVWLPLSHKHGGCGFYYPLHNPRIFPPTNSSAKVKNNYRKLVPLYTTHLYANVVSFQRNDLSLQMGISGLLHFLRTGFVSNTPSFSRVQALVMTDPTATIFRPPVSSSKL